jgi:hypothetical protein
LSCPAGSPKAINLLESQSTDTLIEKVERKSLSMFTLRTFAEAIRLAEQFNDVRMVSETIKQRGGQSFIAKDLHPIGEFEIGGDNQSKAFIKFRAESEKGLCAILGEGDETEFIQNHQVKFEGGGDEAVQAMFILRLNQFIHQSSRSPEAHATTFATGSACQSKSQMSLSKTRVADQYDALSLLNIFAAREVEDLGFVEHGQTREIEVRQFFDDWEARVLQALLQHIELTLIDFLFSQRQQEAHRIMIAARRVRCKLRIQFGKGGQA